MEAYLSDLIKTLFHLKIEEGSRLKFYFYSFIYLLSSMPLIPREKMITLLKNSDEAFIISNRIGTFYCTFQNDSFIKSMDIFEKDCQKALQSEHEGIFIDIGANIGFYSILALNRFNYKEAYAFEPNPSTHNILKRNKELNNLPIKVNEIGLGNKTEEVSFKTNTFHTGSNKIEEGDSKITIKKGDDILEEKAKNISFIKIDVEGHEYETLQGMEKTLNDMPKQSHVFVEISKNKRQIFQLLKRNDFSFITKINRNYLFEKGGLND